MFRCLVKIRAGSHCHNNLLSICNNCLKVFKKEIKQEYTDFACNYWYNPIRNINVRYLGKMFPKSAWLFLLDLHFYSIPALLVESNRYDLFSEANADSSKLSSDSSNK
jgi:hypothetical protein